MKKIIIALAAASVLLFTGCFVDSDTAAEDTATVRINLGSKSATKAIEYGATIPDNITTIKVKITGSGGEPLANPSFNIVQGSIEGALDGIVQITDVPAGNNIRIEIRASQNVQFQEGSTAEDIDTYGFGTTIQQADLVSGGTTQITAYMLPIPYFVYASITTTTQEEKYIEWAMEGPLMGDVTDTKGGVFHIEYSSELNGTYSTLDYNNQALTVTQPEPVPAGPQNPNIYLLNEIPPAVDIEYFIRVRVEDGNKTGLFCEPVPVANGNT